MSRRRKKKNLVAEINVVPYIDVMLVLLIIFMITAPLLTQGVNIDLPQTSSEPMPPEDDSPVVVSVDKNGDLYIDVGEGEEGPVSEDDLRVKIAAVMQTSGGKKSIMVRGDKNVDYGRVVQAMVMIQGAGAPSVGLITEPPEG